MDLMAHTHNLKNSNLDLHYLNMSVVYQEVAKPVLYLLAVWSSLMPKRRTFWVNDYDHNDSDTVLCTPIYVYDYSSCKYIWTCLNYQR